LAQQGGLITVHDAQELSGALARLLRDPDARARRADAARAVVDSHRGALARLLRLIDTLLTEPVPAAAVRPASH
jgi:3-deoxy-D-manno-octulosonic-acid transferase